MVKSYKAHSFIEGVRFSCVSAIKENKVKLFVTLIFVMISIFTGVFIAIKSNNACTLGNLQEINLTDFYTGFVASSSAFFARSLSLVVNVVLLTVLSFSPFLFPLAEVLFVYRGYLFGLNFTLVFIFYGFGAIVTNIIIILPLQLFTLFVLMMYYIIFQRINCNCRKFGGTDCNRFLFFLCGLVILILLNLVETLLLCILNGTVILVI